MLEIIYMCKMKLRARIFYNYICIIRNVQRLYAVIFIFKLSMSFWLRRHPESEMQKSDGQFNCPTNFLWTSPH